MQPYNFTNDDLMNPVYCIGCRAHIPRAVSNAGGGLCPVCAARLISNRPPQHQVSYPTPPGSQGAQPGLPTYAYCPQCHSPYILMLPSPYTNGGKTTVLIAGAIMLVVSFFCLWPLFIAGALLLIVGACMPSINTPGTTRQCQSCGFRWTV